MKIHYQTMIMWIGEVRLAKQKVDPLVASRADVPTLQTHHMGGLQNVRSGGGLPVPSQDPPALAKDPKLIPVPREPVVTFPSLQGAQTSHTKKRPALIKKKEATRLAKQSELAQSNGGWNAFHQRPAVPSDNLVTPHSPEIALPEHLENRVPKELPPARPAAPASEPQDERKVRFSDAPPPSPPQEAPPAEPSVKQLEQQVLDLTAALHAASALITARSTERPLSPNPISDSEDDESPVAQPADKAPSTGIERQVLQPKWGGNNSPSPIKFRPDFKVDEITDRIFGVGKLAKDSYLPLKGGF